MSLEADTVVHRLKNEEGYRQQAYRDSRGFLTIGYGFNIDAGMPEPVAAAALAAFVSMREQELQQFDWYQSMDSVRRVPILDMAFNMGTHSLLHFPHMIAAIAKQDWQTAHDEMLDSDYAKQVGDRAQKLADILLTGKI